MSVVTATLQALTALAPLIEELVHAIIAGNGAQYVSSLSISHPLKSEVALAARKAGIK